MHTRTVLALTVFALAVSVGLRSPTIDAAKDGLSPTRSTSQEATSVSVFPAGAPWLGALSAAGTGSNFLRQSLPLTAAPTPPVVTYTPSPLTKGLTAPKCLGTITAPRTALWATLTMPPENMQPKLSCAQAIAVCEQQGGCNTQGGFPIVELARFSAPTPAAIQPDNSTIPWYTGVLAYIFSWPNVDCMMTSGGPAFVGGAGEPPPPPPPTPRPNSCDVLVVINADTGEGMGAMSGGSS
jgi:hypothetical protein